MPRRDFLWHRLPACVPKTQTRGLCHICHLPALTERRYKLLFVMAEVGHVGDGLNIKRRMRRDHKELAPGKRLPCGTRKLRLQRAGNDVHVFFRVGLEGVFARLDDARRGRAFRCVHGQTLNFSVKIRIVFHGWTSLPVQAKLATRQPAVVARFGWGEATDEPSPLHFAVPGPAREDSRPTEFACCTSTRQVSADLCFTNGTRRTLRT